MIATSIKKLPIDGILLLDKPLNMTSNRLLQRTKHLFGANKAGHTGSLDPLATGMLPICFGNATKFSQFLLEADKIYQVDIILGMKTTTGDAEGPVIATRSTGHITLPLIKQTLSQFTGPLLQVPPMYSAIKYQGRPLYELARQGLTVERTSRPVMIYELTCESHADTTLSLTVKCSKGTYIRTLVEDIGEALGCGAYVAGLRRATVGPYGNGPMITLTALETMHQKLGSDALRTLLLPVSTAVQMLPAIQLPSSAAFYLKMGQAVMVANLPEQKWLRIYDESCHFLGVGEKLEDGRLAPRRLVSQHEMASTS